MTVVVSRLVIQNGSAEQLGDATDQSPRAESADADLSEHARRCKFSSRRFILPDGLFLLFFQNRGREAAAANGSDLGFLLAWYFGQSAADD